MKDAHDYGRDIIWLHGSRRTIWRNVHGKDGRYYIKWGGQYIEIKRAEWGTGWVSVEMY